MFSLRRKPPAPVTLDELLEAGFRQTIDPNVLVDVGGFGTIVRQEAERRVAEERERS